MPDELEDCNNNSDVDGRQEEIRSCTKKSQEVVKGMMRISYRMMALDR